jgi:GT2 family glycosyltransferase
MGEAGAGRRCAAVVIGRNEGARLAACLDSLSQEVGHVVYVDSGSTDGSPEAARARGAEVIALDLARPFTAARARNAGLAALPEGTEHVQFVDGDCVLRPGWIDVAAAFLDRHPRAAAVAGRLRERYPEASVYNRLCDLEWQARPGRARAVGGIFMARVAAVQGVGAFDPQVIAGEEPELCVRLRRAGWEIHRLEAEMGWHDAAMSRFGQWWRRATRAGYAYALGAALHGAPPERHYVRELRRALVWGAALPLAALALALAVSPWALALFAAYPAQIARIARREGDVTRAAFLVLAKVPEALGAARFALDRARSRAPAIIEYK